LTHRRFGLIAFHKNDDQICYPDLAGITGRLYFDSRLLTGLVFDHQAALFDRVDNFFRYINQDNIVSGSGQRASNDTAHRACSKNNCLHTCGVTKLRSPA